jgi:hypothetical protein
MIFLLPEFIYGVGAHNRLLYRLTGGVAGQAALAGPPITCGGGTGCCAGALVPEAHSAVQGPPAVLPHQRC